VEREGEFEEGEKTLAAIETRAIELVSELQN